jgi:Uma2 family endonuclease
MATPRERATIADLYNVEGPAELINGVIVHDLAGERPSEVAENVVVSLRDYARRTKRGKAYPNGLGYVVSVLPSGRESFCPDGSYHTHPPGPNRMRFVEGAPDFGLEVRGENDHNAAAEQRRARKRADYFLAGTLVVWDVDVEAQLIRKFRSSDPAKPTVFRRGDIANAEPAVPGWRIAVDEVFAGG